MKTKWSFLSAIIATALATTTAAYGGTLTTEEQNFKQAFETFRAQFGLNLPMLDESLVAGSRSWSVRMRQTGRFQHGASMENIYQGSGSGVAAFRAWERSPGHRRLLLSPNLESFGVGNDGGYWTFRARARTVERTENIVRTAQPVVAQRMVVQFWRPSFAPRALFLKKRCCR